MKVDWFYARKGCNTCAKSHAFFDANEVDVIEQIDCKREPKSGRNALSVLENSTELLSVQGRSVKSVDLVNGRPDDQTLLNLLLGPTGNLRAPTLRIQDTVVVGYDDDVYEKLLGP